MISKTYNFKQKITKHGKKQESMPHSQDRRNEQKLSSGNTDIGVTSKDFKYAQRTKETVDKEL